MVKMLEINLSIYPRPVREVRSYGDYDVIHNFAERIADGKYYIVNVIETLERESSITINMGRYSTEIMIVIPENKLDKLMEFVEPIKRMMNWDKDTDIIDASAILHNLMHDILYNDENYVDAKIIIEHDEAEGMKVYVNMMESYG